MSKKNRHQSKPQPKPQADDAAEIIRRHLERGQFRDAVKQARVAERRTPTPEILSLLEQASLARSRELLQMNLIPQAVDLLIPIARTTTSAEIRRELPALLFRAGILQQFPQYQGEFTGETREACRQEQFDEAVLRSDGHVGPDDRDVARLVRQALDALGQGQDDSAMELLKNVPRQSPGAQWRVFARGLLGHYRKDHETLQANWSRLEDNRLPSRIAARMKDFSSLDDSQILNSPISRALSASLPDLRILNSIVQLRTALLRSRWDDAFNEYTKCKSWLLISNRPLLMQLTQSVVAQLSHSNSIDLMKRFMRIGEPLPIDPKWNRALALAMERDDNVTISLVEQTWEAFINDLNTVTCLSDTEKALATSLVWFRLASFGAAQHVAMLGDDDSEPKPYFSQDFARNAIRRFELSLQANPNNRDVWLSYSTFLLHISKVAEGGAVARRALVLLPNDVDLLRLVVQNPVDNNDYRQALPYARKLQQLRPLDDNSREALIDTLRGAARQDVSACDYASARTTLSEAIALERDGDQFRNWHNRALSAINEFHAKDLVAADNFVSQAVACWDEATPTWLRLASEACRLNSPAPLIAQFEKKWQTDLKKPCKSQTAAVMSNLLMTYINGNVHYKQRQSHVDAVVNYINRCSRVKFGEDDHYQIVEFLLLLEERELGDVDKLIQRHVSKGIKQFPNVALYHKLAGDAAKKTIGSTSRERNQARKHYQRALDLCEGKSDSVHEEMAEEIREILYPRPSFGGGFYDYFDDDDDEDDDEYPEDFSHARNPARRITPHDIDELIASAPPEIQEILRELKDSPALMKSFIESTQEMLDEWHALPSGSQFAGFSKR